MPYGPNGEVIGCGCNDCSPVEVTDRARSLAEQLQTYAQPEEESGGLQRTPSLAGLNVFIVEAGMPFPTANARQGTTTTGTVTIAAPTPEVRRQRCNYGCYMSHPEDEMQRLPRWGWVCNGCLTGSDPRFWHCVRCDSWAYLNDRCNGCRSSRCATCTTVGQYMTMTAAGTYACDPCLDSEHWECEECGGLWPNSQSECQNYHQPDDDGGGELVHSYSYRPRPRFRGDGPLYFGMEIEVEIGGDHDEYRSAERTVEVFGDLAYLKEDGSIDGGFEIVTHPMSYPWALENFPWDGFGRLRESAGLRSRRSCGLHIHVSKKGFSGESHAYRWLKFIHRNKREVRLFARRECDEYASFTDRGRRDAKHYVKGGSGERYQAINPNNRHTFEMRMFASTTYRTQLKAALSFAAATVEYTRMLDANAILARKAWSWEAFTSWVVDDRQQPLYRPLPAELRRLGLL